MSELVEAILKNRGYTAKAQRERFLRPRYDQHPHDPTRLPDIEAATERVKRAIEAGETITVYGDYDIDGLSATALLLDGLGAMGARVARYIPDRFQEGYGINREALQRLHGAGAGLIITVDCGSVSYEPLAWAAEVGLDVIVTDHHETGVSAADLPPAVAIVNPKRPDSDYAFSDLAGVGVAFKLIRALQHEHQLLPPGREKWLLDLVALGTVCDVVDLVDENRVLVSYGLEVFRRTPRVGLQALAKVAGIPLEAVDTYHFGFVLGPRLNAAGRLEHALRALEVLTTTDKSEALAAARELDELNNQRRIQQDEILTLARQQAEEYADDPVLVLSHPNWNHGIVGIVASKIMEQYKKPTVILQEQTDMAKGSARSLGEFSMVAALRSADAVLDTYGGHQVAAGCRLPKDNIPALREALHRYYAQHQFGDLDIRPEPDMTLQHLGDMREDTYQALQSLAPFGKGNPRPLFYAPDLGVRQVRPVGKAGDHLKLTLTDGSDDHEAIAFGFGARAASIDDTVGAWFELDMNTYKGRTRPQLRVTELT
jgi:single-stranded-DNA-specific exonuclease